MSFFYIKCFIEDVSFRKYYNLNLHKHILMTICFMKGENANSTFPSTIMKTNYNVIILLINYKYTLYV